MYNILLYFLIILTILILLLILKNKNEKFTLNTIKKISFCITCMNRFSQLKTTLKKNLNNNKKFSKDIEFIIVNFIIDKESYKIHNFIINNFKTEIKSNYLK